MQAELFVVWLNDGRLELTGPCGAAPWIIELGEDDPVIAATLPAEATREQVLAMAIRPAAEEPVPPADTP